MPKYSYKPVLAKVEESYLKYAKKEFKANVDIESEVVLIIKADNEEDADFARIGFTDREMWKLYQIED